MLMEVYPTPLGNYQKCPITAMQMLIETFKNAHGSLLQIVIESS